MNEIITTMNHLRNSNEKEVIFITQNSSLSVHAYHANFICLTLTFFILILYKIQSKFQAFFERINQKLSDPLHIYLLKPLKDSNIQEIRILEKMDILYMLFNGNISRSPSNVHKLIKQNVSNALLNRKSFGIGLQNQLMDPYVESKADSFVSYSDVLESLMFDPNDVALNVIKEHIVDNSDKDFKILYKTLFISRDHESYQMKYLSLFNRLLINQQNRLSKKRKLFCVEILIKYLESLNFDIEEPINEWDDDILSEYDQNKTFVVMQNYLASSGAIKTFIQYVCEEQDYQVLLRIFRLANGMLIGGNEDVQNILFAELEESRKEVFIKTIKDLICKLFDEICSSAKFLNKITKQQLDSKIRSNKQQEFIKQRIFNDEDIYEMSFERKKLKLYYDLLNSIYRFLQLSTEGQFVKFQDYYSSYKSETCEINLIAITASWLKEYFEFNFIDDYNLVETIFDFLIEVVQGPHISNQKFIFECKMIEICKSYIYEVGLNEKIYEENYIELLSVKNNRSIKKIIKLFYSMLESNHNKIYIESMRSNLDKHFFKNKLQNELKSYLESKNISIKEDKDFVEVFKKRRIHEFEEDIQNAFDYFFLSKKLNIDFEDEKKDYKTAGEPNFLYFYESYSTHIEIKINGELQTIYFVIHPICKFLNDKNKAELINNIEQKEKSERVYTFFEQLTDVFLKLRHQANIENNRFMWFIATVNIRLLFIILAVLLNLIILIWMDSKVEDNILYPNYFHHKSTEITFHIVEYALVALCVIRLLIYVLINFTTNFQMFWRAQIANYATQIDKSMLTKQEKMILDRVNDIKLTNSNIKDIIKIYLKKDGYGRVNNSYLNFYFVVKGIRNFILQSDFM